MRCGPPEMTLADLPSGPQPPPPLKERRCWRPFPGRKHAGDSVEAPSSLAMQAPDLGRRDWTGCGTLGAWQANGGGLQMAGVLRSCASGRRGDSTRDGPHASLSAKQKGENAEAIGSVMSMAAGNFSRLNDTTSRTGSLETWLV